MTKLAITRLFVGGTIAAFAGIFLGVVAVLIAIANTSFTFNGPDVTSFRPTPFAWTMIAVAALGCLAFIGGAIANLVSWIGALINTAQFDDKTWFVVLLVLGLLSFGFVAMIAYVIAGPDSTRLVRQQPAPYPI